MKRQDFQYDLPSELIAQTPSAERGTSRMLCLDRQTGAVRDQMIADLPGLLQPGDLLVLNNTRVIPARLYGYKPSGGRIEIMIERVLENNHVRVKLHASNPNRIGSRFRIASGIEFEIVDRSGELYDLSLHAGMSIEAVLEQHGHMPLPPYIQRADTEIDQTRYQTVYAEAPGAVAAPTAGLHFTEALLQQVRARGVDTCYITLHVGLGTFQPMRVDNITDHVMHYERLEVSSTVCAAVARARQAGGRVIAVGTTAVRSLETAAATGELQPYRGETNLFIYPGYEFRAVDALLTNFHLPESTLLMLVSAFAGREQVLAAYRHAVAAEYRFFSYGDAMFIH